MHGTSWWAKRHNVTALEMASIVYRGITEYEQKQHPASHLDNNIANDVAWESVEWLLS